MNFGLCVVEGEQSGTIQKITIPQKIIVGRSQNCNFCVKCKNFAKEFAYKKRWKMAIFFTKTETENEYVFTYRHVWIPYYLLISGMIVVALDISQEIMAIGIVLFIVGMIGVTIAALQAKEMAKRRRYMKIDGHKLFFWKPLIIKIDKTDWDRDQ